MAVEDQNEQRIRFIGDCYSPVLPIWMLPLLVATELGSPLGTKILLLLVPKLTATHVLQTTPATQNTKPNPLSRNASTSNLSDAKKDNLTRVVLGEA